MSILEIIGLVALYICAVLFLGFLSIPISLWVFRRYEIGAIIFANQIFMLILFLGSVAGLIGLGYLIAL